MESEPLDGLHGIHNLYTMDKLCVLIEKRDGQRQVQYSDERPDNSFWIKSWHFVSLSTEKIDEIENATLQRVQDILKTL